MYSNPLGDSEVGFRELVVALSQAPHESLFSTELVQVLVEHFWARYYRTIFFRCLIPYSIYIILVLVYLTEYVVRTPEPDEEDGQTGELVMRITIIIFAIYFAIFDLVCLLRDSLRYITDIFNWFDILSFVINIEMILEPAHNLY